MRPYERRASAFALEESVDDMGRTVFQRRCGPQIAFCLFDSRDNAINEISISRKRFGERDEPLRRIVDGYVRERSPGIGGDEMRQDCSRDRT
jgi:hypothetical protein